MHRPTVSAISQASIEAVSDGLALPITEDSEKAKPKEGRDAASSCASSLVATRPAIAFPALLQCSTMCNCTAGQPQSSPSSSSRRTLAHEFVDHVLLAGRSITIAAAVCADGPTAYRLSAPVRARRHRGCLAALDHHHPCTTHPSRKPRGAVPTREQGSLVSLGVVWCRKEAC